MPLTARVRTLRWLSPLAVLAMIIGLVVVPSQLASASPPPSLPTLTAQQLLTRVQSARPPDAFSGTIRLTANLGIPNLSQLSGQDVQGLDVLSYLSGNHDARVWFEGPQRARLALVDHQLSETDIIRNGANLWIWQSNGSQVTHQRIDQTRPRGREAFAGTEPVPTPDQLARTFLAKVDPTTAVSVQPPLRVAGRAAYQLVLSPRGASSTIDQVTIAVDSATSLPLRVAVLARGQSKPAVSLGFTSLSFAKPAASTFAFSAPPGSHPSKNPFSLGGDGGRRFRRRGVATAPVQPPVAHGAKVLGKGWTAVLIVSGVNVPGAVGPILKAATPVAGGRLLQTALVNVLLMNDGRIAVGAVSPAALESAAAGAG